MNDALRWIIGFAVTIAAILFAVANRASVAIIWSPSLAAIDIPLGVAILIGTAIGFVSGAAFVWLNGIGERVEHRRHKKKLATLEKQIESSAAVTGNEQA